MFTEPDEHMPYIIQLHIMSIQRANKAAEREGDGGGERERERQTERQTDRELELKNFILQGL